MEIKRNCVCKQRRQRTGYEPVTVPSPKHSNLNQFHFQLEIIDACVSYIEKLQSQLLVTDHFQDQSEEEEESDVEDEQQQQQQQQQQHHHQQQLRRLSSYELEDCNGNVEK